MIEADCNVECFQQHLENYISNFIDDWTGGVFSSCQECGYNTTYGGVCVGGACITLDG